MVTQATVDDSSGAAALLRAVYTGELFTSAGLRHSITRADPRERRAFWKVEADRAIVGWASAGLDTYSSERGRAFAGVSVHPDARRRGVGAALWNAVGSHLDDLGVRKTSVRSRDDAEAARFAEARGFTHASSDTLLVADPRQVEPDETPTGIEIMPMIAFADDLEALFACDVESAQDEPGPFDFSGITFETWLVFWEHPDLDRDLSMAAVASGRVVGTTFLRTDRSSALGEGNGTGVVPAFRGRRIGLAMKQASLARAAEAGLTRVVTHNDETNAPMLAINRRLGYRPLATGRWWLRES